MSPENPDASSDAVRNNRHATLRWWLVVGLGIGGFLAAFIVFRLLDQSLPLTGPPANGADLKSYFIPAMAFMRQAFFDGELPLWNPYQLAGSPFIALHGPGALYPLLFIFTPLPPHVALIAHALLHYVLAGLFSALYARKIGLPSAACLVAGLAYVGSPPLVDAAFNTGYLSTFVWLPAILLAVESICDTPGRRTAVLLAGVLALCFLAGHPQAFVYSVFIAAPYGALRLLTSQPSAKWVSILVWSTTAGLLAAGLMAIQILPTASHANTAARNLDGLNYHLARWSALRWHHLPSLLTGQDGPPLGLPFLFAPLTIAALFSRQRVLALTLLSIFLLSFDYMTGVSALGSKLYYALPAGNLFRLPQRMAFAYHALAAALMALGVSAVISGAKRWGSTLAIIAAITIPAILALDLFVRNPLRFRYDLWRAPWSVPGAAETSPLLNAAGFDRLFIQNRAKVTIPRKFGMLHRAFILPDYDPLLPGIYRPFFQIPPKGLWHGTLDIVDPWRGRPLNSVRKPILQPPTRLDLLSVRYYVDARHGAASDPKKLGPASQLADIHVGQHAVYKRETAVPRTYIVKDIVGVNSEADALARVHALDFDPARTAIVVGPPAQSSETPAANEGARITSFRRNDVRIEASCNSDCLLVLTDLYDPDWSVQVDGQPTTLLRTNYLVRGVRLNPGTHTVDFHYRAPAFWTGAAITLAALLVSGYLALSGREHKRVG